MSDEEAQVDWDDNGLLDMDECHAKIRQLCTILGSVEATLADCGTGGVYAEFDTPADAIAQMNDQIKELTARLATLDAAEAQVAKLKQQLAQMEAGRDFWRTRSRMLEQAMEAKIAPTLQAERQLRREAERVAKSLHLTITDVREALNECGVEREGMSTHARVLSLGQRAERAETERDEASGNLRRIVELNEWSRNELDRVSKHAERAEALAAPVTEETAGLLERLVDIVHNWGDWDSCGDDLTSTRKLAAQIREALDDGQA